MRHYSGQNRIDDGGCLSRIPYIDKLSQTRLKRETVGDSGGGIGLARRWCTSYSMFVGEYLVGSGITFPPTQLAIGSEV